MDKQVISDHLYRVTSFQPMSQLAFLPKVGKRYRRQDAIGTPLCVTVDGQTLEDNTVTVRHRDTMQQERVAIDALFGLVDAECSLRSLLKKLNV